MISRVQLSSRACAVVLALSLPAIVIAHDGEPLSIVSAAATSANSVQAVFSEPVEAASALTLSNYFISSGVTISAAILAPDTQTVTITTTPLPVGNYRLTVNNVNHFDDPANPIATNSQAAFSVEPNLTPGLVAHWRFEEGNSATTIDSSGNGHTATLMNGTQWTLGKSGGGASLDGLDDHIAVGGIDVTGSGITLAAWVKMRTLPCVDARFISKATDPTTAGHWWMLGHALDAGTDRIRFRLKAGGETSTLVANSGNVPTNIWFHAAATYDGSMMRVYLNGIEVGAASKSGVVDLNPDALINLGRNPDGSGALPGQIDEVQVYDRGLTPSEIVQLMNTTTVADTQSPVVAITTPTDGTTISNIFTVTADATDNIVIAAVELRLDGNPLGLTDTLSPYSVQWNTDSVPNGPYSLTAVATDANGNNSTSAPVSVVIANVLQNEFINEILLENLNFVATMEFLPNGNILLGELGGVIHVLQPDASAPEPTPFNVLPAPPPAGDTGLLDIIVDPGYSSNNYYYVVYYHTSLRDRVSRFTATSDGNSTVPGSEFIVWQSDPTVSTLHHGGGLAFGADGKLYISTGDNGFAQGSQQLDTYNGKILRVNSDGSIPTDNPFYDAEGPNKDEIWSYGLRNPFRMVLDEVTGRMYVSDVGGNDFATAFEELNLVEPGANYGWPNCEGPCGDPDNVTDPIYAYHHSCRDASIIGGFVYRGSQFPNEYQGSFFFADYAQNWIRRLTFDTNGVVQSVQVFDPPNSALDDPGIGDPVKLKQGPDGALYYLDLSATGSDSATLRRIRYIGTSNHPPVAAVSADPIAGPAPLLVAFSSVGSSDSDGDALTYDWDFGDGSNSTEANPAHEYQTNGQYIALLTVSDGVETGFKSIQIRVGSPPIPTIATPLDASTFQAGENILIQGSATDFEDGIMPSDALDWRVVFLHEGHVHPVLSVDGTNQLNYPIPSSGHDYGGFTRYQIILTATDSNGLTGTTSTLIFPEKVNLYFDSVPSGLTLTLSGIDRTTPFVHDEVIGFQHTIEAPDQSYTGTDYRFTEWTDAGAQAHSISISTQTSNYTATFEVAADITPPELTSVTALDSTTVSLLFNEPVDEESAQAPGNYAIDGSGDVTWAILKSDNQTVMLVTSPLSPGNHTLAVNGVGDRATPSNWIAPGSQIGFTVTPTASRATNGLVALYGFEEGLGTNVNDISGIDPPQNLNILDTNSIQWLGAGTNGVRFTLPGSAIRSSGPADKVNAALTATSQVSLEAWVTSADLSQNNPERIVTISGGTATSDMNLHLGQETTSAAFRLRTSNSSFSELQADNVFTDTNTPRHLVLTYDGTTKRVFVDGIQHSSTEVLGGNFSNWNSTYSLLLGNESTLDRSWLGTLHLVALYDRALAVEEIQQNLTAGAAANTYDTQPPTITAVIAEDSETVRVLFSEPVELSSAQALTNYGINNGVTVITAVLGGDTRTVTLTTSTLPNGGHTLTVDNIADRAAPPNYISSGSTANFNHDPTAPAVPVILSINILETNNLRITWSATSNVTYAVQYSPGLDTPWATLFPEVLATGTTAVAVDSSGMDSQRFYRVLVVDP